MISETREAVIRNKDGSITLSNTDEQQRQERVKSRGFSR
jgi:hypothetical protein